MKRLSRLAAALLAVSLLLSLFYGCTPKEDKRPIVAVSVLPEVEFVSAVLGDGYRVVSMVPPGYSPESYTPTIAEMQDFSNAVLYFSIGVPVEEASLLPILAEGTTHVSLSDEVRKTYPDRMIDGGRDPHIWLSPKRVSVMVDAVAAAAALYDPENAALYADNAAAYRARLNETDEAVRRLLSGAASREFLVYHPAFGYFADEYDLSMHALEAGGREVTPAELQATIEYAKEKGIKTVFYQAETDGRTAGVLADEIGGRAVMLSPLSENYLENLLAMATAIADGASAP